MRFLRSGPLLLLAMLSVSACGDSATGPAPELGREESIELFTELMEAVQLVLNGSPAFSAGAAPGQGSEVARDELEEYTLTVPCDGGGSITARIEERDDLSESPDGSGTIAFTMVQEIRSCRVVTSTGTYALNTDPAMSIGIVLSLVEFLPTRFTYTWTGGLRFAGPRTGRCGIDLVLTQEYSAGGTTTRQTMRGSLCGHSWNDDMVF